MTRIREALTTRGSAFVAAGLTLLVGGLAFGFEDITRVGGLLATLPLLAAVIARRGSSSLVVTRTVHPARLTVGQSARVEVLLQNTSDVRTRLQYAEERVHPQLGDRPRFVLPAMEPGEVREVEYQIRSQTRGRYRLGPLMLRVQDPYGLATVAASVPGATDVLVLPHIEVLDSARARGEGFGAEGALPHMIAQHGEDDLAVRSYRYGDDLRRIHWPATAHRSQLMVRQEDRPAMRKAVVILDSREVAHQGSGPAGSFEWAVTAAASTAAHLTERRYAIHLVSDETTAEGRASQHFEIDDLLAALAMARLGGAAELDQVLDSAAPLTSTGGLVVAIVTDHDEEAVRRMAALRQPGGTGLMFVIDSTSFAAAGSTARDGQAAALADMVAAAGWSTCVVGSGMTVGQAWTAAAAHTGTKVGGGL